MLEIVALDTLRRGGKSEALEYEPIVRGNRKELGAVAALDAVIAFFQFAAADALSILGDGLGASFSALAYALPLEDKVVPPNPRVSCGSVNRHTFTFLSAHRRGSLFLF